MQYANNNQVEDFLQSSITELQDFSGKSLELKYYLKSETDLKKFLENQDSMKRQIEKIRTDLRFSKIICRFYFGNYHPTLELQKKLISFQEDIFDEITVQMIKDNFDNFKIVYEYTKNKTEKSVSTLIDPILNPALLIQIISYFSEITPTNTRWIYHQLDTYIDRLRIISKTMKELGIDYYLTGCRKIYGGKTEFRNIDVSTMCKAYFGFKGCCLDYRSAKRERKKGQKVFVKDMYIFEEQNYEWKKVKNDNYKTNRLRDYVKLDRINPTKEEIEIRERIKLLCQYLDKQNP
jgi:hypothetical protein